MKRILSWILVLTLAVGLLPAQVFANQLENQEEQLVVQPEETLAQPEETVAAEEEAIVQPEETVAAETVPEETTAPVPEAVPETVPENEELASVKATFSQPDEKPDNDELLGGYLRKQFYRSDATYSIAAGSRLKGDEKIIYDALVPIIKQIAAGNRESTFICVGETIYTDNGYYYSDANATFKTKGISDAGLGRIVNALLSDLPYDFYWYDKVRGCECSSYYNTSTNIMSQFQIAFTVADNYGPVHYYRVDTDLTKRAAASAENSFSIVEKYEGKTDYEKLVGYKNEICNLVTYDDEAAYYGYFSQNNDPWQLIHVFDGDSTTNVVCEGYSKAFMYLCEQTSFGADISCVLATGIMGGPHMWNIVQISGKNYLVDVTNSESNCVGWDGSLFLTGGSGSIAKGYTVSGYKYTYDDETKTTWGTGTDSVLYLASKNYDSHAVIAKGSCGKNLKWELTGVGVLTISGTGVMYDYWDDFSPWFDYYPTIKTVVIEEGVTTVSSGAFWDISEMTSISLPSTLTTIGENAFTGCHSLQTITIPASVKTIKDEAFALCYDLDGIWVDAGNANYSSDFRGVLFNKKKTTLIAAPGTISGSYVVPESVIRIEADAFYFYDGLQSIWIPLSVKQIGNYALADTGLTDVYYAGTQAQWYQVDIEYEYEYWFPKVIMHYSSPHSHTYVNYAGQAATCTEPGWQPYGECSTCGYSSYAVIPALGHSYTETVTKPTFTSEGYTDFYCTRCGYSYRGNYKAPLELSAPEVRYQSGALEFGEYIEGFVYEIYRSTSKSGSFKLVDEIVAEACRWEDTTGTAGKTYYYKVKALCAEDPSLNSPFSGVVSMAIQCASPELRISVNSSRQPVLSWNKVTGAKKYEIHRSVDDGPYKKLTTVTKTTYTDTSAPGGSKCAYKVKALASKSTYNSPFSYEQGCYVVCAAPSLTAKIDTATGKPSLSWGKVTGAVGYNIYRSDNGGEYVLIAPRTSTVSYLDTDTRADNKYSYKVVALGRIEAFDSAASAEKTVTVTVGQPKLTGTINEQGKAVITWLSVEDAEAYIVYRSTSSSKSYKAIETVTDLSYTDTGITAGKTYYYKVAAVGRNSESAQSAYVKLTGKCDIPVLEVQAGSTGKPVLTWNKISGAKKYEIWRSVNGAAFKKLTTTTKTTYTDTKATEGAECTYKVKALGSKSSYNSLFSVELGCYVTCAAPTLTVKIDTATGKPSLSWSKVTGATGYDIYRSENGGGFEKLTNVTDTTYLDEATKADNKYTYYILSVGKAEVFNSVNSAEKTVTVTVAQPKLTGSINEAGKAVITWNAVEDAVKYEIYRSTKANKSYKLVDTVTELTYTDTGITAGKTYYYKVVAVGSNSKSAQSAYVKLTGKCAQPVISVGFDQNSGKPVITWEKVTGAKKYELYRSTDGENYTKLTTVTKTTYTDTKAKTGTFYYYQVRAVGSKSSYNSVFSQRRGCLCVCAKPVVTVKMDSKQWQPALTWKTVEGAESYEIYRALRGGNFVLLATVTEPAYLDQTAQIGDLYRYKVKALSSQPLCNMEGDQVLFSVPCEKVTVKAVADPTGKPALTWEATEGATVYAVYRSTKKSSGFKLYSQVITTSYTDKNAKKGTTYYYYVTAMAQDTESAVSNTVKIKCSK